jgi:hypothetical protein
MHTIVGQTKLVSALTKFNYQTLPPAILLVGPIGSGKHYITECFAKSLNVELIEITNSTTAEDLLDYSQSPVAKIFWVDLSEVSEKAQNKLLKFIEEPSSTVRIILGAEAKVGILPTILNRCITYTLEAYSLEELQSFSWSPKGADPQVYYFCNTPGALLTLGDADSFKAIYQKCESIIESFPKMADTQFAQAIGSYADIKCKDTQANKLDFDLFLKVLTHVAFECWKLSGDEFAFRAYLVIEAKRQAALNKTVAKEAFLLSLLDELWEVSRV